MKRGAAATRNAQAALRDPASEAGANAPARSRVPTSPPTQSSLVSSLRERFPSFLEEAGMEERQLTQGLVHIRCSMSTVRSIEREKRRPPRVRARAIARTLLLSSRTTHSNHVRQSFLLPSIQPIDQNKEAQGS